MTRLSQINRDNLKWFGRMALILLLVGVAEALVVLFVRKPLPWVVVIPALIPLLGNVFVFVPMTAAHKSGSPNV